MYCYDRPFPEEEEVVMCLVKEITEYGAVLELLEYGNIPAMAPLVELSRRKIHQSQLSKAVPVGRTEPMLVTKVDEEKGYIDCSKRQLTVEEGNECRTRYADNKLVYNIWNAVNNRYPIEQATFYEKIVYPLQEKGNVIAGLKGDLQALNLDQELLSVLRKVLEEKFRVPIKKHRLLIELTCYGPEGIDGVITTIRAMERLVPGLKVRYLAPPVYAVEMESNDEANVQKKIDLALAEGKRVVTPLEGYLKKQGEASLVGEADTLDLLAQKLDGEVKTESMESLD
ncbi:MAG: S1 RNA-binding domain-containing protein [Nitrososphaerales archaeon]